MRNKSKILSLALAAGLAAGNIGALPMNVFAADNNNETTVSPADGATPINDALNKLKNNKNRDKNQEYTIYLKEGVYNERISIDIPNVKIQGISNGNEKPVISGAKLSVYDGSDMIRVNADDVSIENVEVTGLWINEPNEEVNPVGIRIVDGSSNVTISDCEIDNLGCKYNKTKASSKYNAHGIIASGYDEEDDKKSIGINNVTINDCYLHDLKLGYSEALVMNGNVDTFFLYNNKIEDCDNIAIDIIGYEHAGNEKDRARNGEVYNNTVKRVSTKNNNTYRQYSCGGIYVDGGTLVNIHDNYVESCDIGIELASEHTNKKTDYVTVTNNILYNNTALSGLSIGGSDDDEVVTGFADNCTIQNNTVYNESGSCFVIQKAASDLNVISDNAFYAGKNAYVYKNSMGYTGNTFKNNIINKNQSPNLENTNKSDKVDSSLSVNVDTEAKTATVTTSEGSSDKGANITWGITPYTEPEVGEPEVVEPEIEVPTTEEAFTTEQPSTSEPIVENPTTEDPNVVVLEPEDSSPYPLVHGDAPSYNVHDDSNFYTIDENNDRIKITYTKKKSENWKHVNVDFDNIDLSKYSKVVFKIKPSRKANLGITNQDENNPVFYRNHWNSEGKFTSTKEQTVTVDLTEDNANGLYLYFDATSNDSKNKETTIRITDIWFE